MTNYLKTIFLTVFPFMVTTFFAYLIGSFLNVSLSPADWTNEMRILMSEFGIVFGAALYWRLYWDGMA